MEKVALAAVLGYLAFKALHYWLCWGALVSYMAAKDYPVPDDFGKWTEWYLRKSLGLTADLPDKL